MDCPVSEGSSASSFIAFILLYSVVASPLFGGQAREFIVGSENNLWAVPSFVDEFNKWAKKTRFQIGDSLVLKYDSKTDSVLEVTEEDYKICPFFFISEADEHWKKGQKLKVMVLSDKHCSGHQSTVQVPSPHHQHHHYHPPAPALTNDGTSLKAAEGFICGTATVESLVLLLREFVIGGENNLWAFPSSVDEFNKWAEKTNFQIGDCLVPKYDSKADSVLEVTEEDYKIYNNANLIK
ncbi:early nodulin-like protein 3 [Olea europaea var. sylvestris]|uniref:early nodulin-like protein 3 n=1 Tax=Olea europaea var. sylvestris TaxID=158386 RepID=UPI000C1CF55A|nr:early nodulin-like protein 3 [Olea europaea var. sylvestris]